MNSRATIHHRQWAGRNTDSSQRRNELPACGVINIGTMGK